MMWRIGLSAVLLFGAAALGMWINDREPPNTVLSVDVLTPTVRPGTELRILYHVQRWRTDCAVHVDRVLYDSRNASFPVPDVDFAASPSAKTGADSVMTIIYIAPNMAEGKARFRSVSTFRCNPMHNIWPIKRESPEIIFNVAGFAELPTVILPPGTPPPIIVSPETYKDQERVPDGK
jgi:hypothetical protein